MGEAVVDVGVADEEIEADSGASGLEHVLGGRGHLLAVDQAADMVALNVGLDLVAVLHAVLRADELLQRREIPDIAIPAHDLRVALVGLEASPENLIAAAPIRFDLAAQDRKSVV